MQVDWNSQFLKLFFIIYFCNLFFTLSTATLNPMWNKNIKKLCILCFQIFIEYRNKWNNIQVSKITDDFG